MQLYQKLNALYFAANLNALEMSTIRLQASLLTRDRIAECNKEGYNRLKTIQDNGYVLKR